MKEKKSIQIRSGKDVCETFRMQGLWKKRDCYQDLEYFMKDNSANTYGKICALYGLRRSGKTVMMEQCISAMPEEEQEKCFYLLCRRNSEADVDTLYDCLDGLMEQGAKYIFIDEITYLHGFQAAANELSDYYGKMAKIVIAGTDSLGIRFSMSDSLYDRVYPIHTTRVPYAEWARILKGKTIDDYIRYGGLLTVEPYRDKQHRDEYLNTSIADNIMHSMMEGHEGRKYFRALSDLYDEELLKSLVNKMINRFSYNVVLSAVQSDYKNVPLHTTVNNMGRRLYKKKLNLDEVTARTKTALGILNEDETERKLQRDDLLELKNYLAALDLFVRIPTFSSLEKYQKSLDTEVLTQPGMVYAHATVLADALAQDEAWKEECLEEEKTQFRFRAENEVRGRILENVVLSETYLAIGAKEMSQYFYVSQLTVRGMES
ncbi:MAG: AAA family ATPase, partial [Clostridiales bacterium]|nr:AAA family ATPase [Clostridiales bacterium]